MIPMNQMIELISLSQIYFRSLNKDFFESLYKRNIKLESFYVKSVSTLFRQLQSVWLRVFSVSAVYKAM